MICVVIMINTFLYCTMVLCLRCGFLEQIVVGFNMLGQVCCTLEQDTLFLIASIFWLGELVVTPSGKKLTITPFWHSFPLFLNPELVLSSWDFSQKMFSKMTQFCINFDNSLVLKKKLSKSFTRSLKHQILFNFCRGGSFGFCWKFSQAPLQSCPEKC